MNLAREERGKMMNTRKKLQFKEEEEDDIQLEPKRVQQTSTRRGKAIIRASEVSNRQTQQVIHYRGGCGGIISVPGRSAGCRDHLQSCDGDNSGVQRS